MKEGEHIRKSAFPRGRDRFDDLLAEHQRRIYFFIRSMVFDPEEAKDILQDVNIIALRKRGRFAPGSDFKSWTFAIARFECLAYLSRRKKHAGIGCLSDEVSAMLVERAEQRADEIEPWLDALEMCRRALPEDAARLVEARYRDRATLETLAGELDTTEGALKQKLLRIRRRLKRCILARGQGRFVEFTRNAAGDLE